MAGLYIHVPFCECKCAYCDFYSRANISVLRNDYLSSVVKEMQMRKDFFTDSVFTLYFGGGTPSLLSAGEISYLINSAQRVFDCNLIEITLEANPNNISSDYLKNLKRAGVNRLSVGVQSFFEDDLNVIGRKQKCSDATDVIKLIQDSGFDNISIDLIYGLPGQTLSRWQENIEKAVNLDVCHISAYHLTFEEGTPLYKKREKGIVAPVGEDESVAMFKMLRQILIDSGYEHYEISNFAKNGRYSRHNSSYWDGTHYLGLGPSAHSYNGRCRFWNVSDTRSYINSIRDGAFAADVEDLSLNDKFNDYIITGLRTSKGICAEYAEQVFGEVFKTHILKEAERHLSAGRLFVEDGFVKLTEDGMFVSDGIMEDFIIV